MSDQERDDQLNDALDEIISAGERPKTTGDAETDRLARLAEGLKGLPDPAFKARLKAELFPRNPFPSRFWRWLRSDRRRTLAAIAVSLGVAGAIGTVLYFTARGDGEQAMVQPPPTPTPSADECRTPASIDPLPSDGPDDWQDISLPPPNDCFRMTASLSDAAGVAPDSDFTLDSREPTSADELAARIEVQPDLRFHLQPLSDSQASAQPGTRTVGTRFRVVPDAPLAEDTVYTFSVLNEPGGLPVSSWAFQTQRPLRVVQTLPADQSTDVPLNVGIELTFSHDDVTGVEDTFQIDPPVQGRFETHKRTVVFVPKELLPQTLYTVTVGPGVGIEGSDQTLGEPFTFQFETGSTARTGETPGGLSLQFSRRTWESSTTQAPVLALLDLEGMPGSVPSAPLAFTVYLFPGVDAFLASLDQFTSLPSWASASRTRFTVDTSGLEEAASFDAAPKPIGDTSEMYVPFPEPLPVGYYLVETEFEGHALQAWLQVTDVATYVSVSRTRTLLWVNDAASGTPIESATVRLAGADFIASTGSEGAAFFDTPQDLIRLEQSPFGYTTSEAVGNLIVTAPDGRTAVVPLADIFSGFLYFGYKEYGFWGDPGLYWRFLYTDRHLYRPTDTVHFWGLARHRADPPPSQEVIVEISGEQFSETGDYLGPVGVVSTSVTTSAAGTFIGELPLKGVSPGYYSLQARIGDQVITSIYLEVEDFVKPAYKSDVPPAKRAVFTGEEMEFVIEASFFDGTPVPNLELNVISDVRLEGRQSITTDENGRAVVPFVGSATKGNYITVTPDLAEEGEITGTGWVQVFPAAVYLESASEFSDGTATVSGTVYNVDIQRLNSEEANSLVEDPEGGLVPDSQGLPAPGRTVTARVVEESYRQIEVGETYDFIAKIVRKRYRYETVRTSLGQFTATSDAQGRFAISFAAEKDKSYEATLQVKDDEGRTYSEQTYVYGGTYFSSFGDLPYLAPASHDPVAVGETVQVAMRQGAEDLPGGGDNRYLFYLAQNGIRSYATEDGPRYSFPFTKEHVPSVSVFAVRFAGGTYQETSYPQIIRFDQTLRRLDISVETDQERYRPGEEATLNVTVTDRDGRPVQAEVLLSAVDEAVFRLQGDSFFYDLDILESLYTPVFAGVLRTYASHQYPAENYAAERGGGDGARDNFKDTALFDRVTTDAQGQASITFELPDNLTSWRVTALAVAPDLHAGSAISLVPVGLPFFADVAMNTSYLTTDRPSIKLRAFGDALEDGDPVSFRVTSDTLLEEPLTASGTAFTAVDVPLPPLREGRHQLTVRATSGGLEDSLVRTVIVIPSRLLRSESRFHEVRPGESPALEGSRDRLTIVIVTDHNRGRYYPLLRSLTWTYGDRVDQMLARNLAQELLLEHFQEESDFPAEFRPSLYQTEDGGIAILPFADDDLVLSARLAALASERFGRQDLIRYFERVADDEEETSERVIIALYGLAALGEPVLPTVQALATRDDLSPRERLYVALAATELNDGETAGALYRDIMEEFGQRRGDAARLDVGKDKDDVLEATSLAAIIAASLGDDFAPLLFNYTTENYTKDILVQLEQISFLAEALPNLSPAPVRFAYTVEGRREERELERGQSLALLLTPEELDALDLEALEGTLGVTTSFLAPFEPEDVGTDPEIALSRTYQGQSDGITLLEGDLVRVTLSYELGAKAEDGCYQVSDLLPSGLRPVTDLWAGGVTDIDVSYPYAVDGQRVSFCAFRQGRQKPIVYYARVIGKGEYTAEPAVIQSQQTPESINFTESMLVEIR